MPIYTTYLAFLRKAKYNPLNIFPHALKETIIHYVMRNRGNNDVAPDADMLKNFKKLEKAYSLSELWPQYEENYLIQIGLSKKARNWMQKTAEESKRANVVLVCYEKNAQFCHRRLLAEEISRRYGADYKGELTTKDIKQSLSFSVNSL